VIRARFACTQAAAGARVARDYDAVVVGAGPNGLAAAITLARAGCSVLLLEGKAQVGGGARTAELTLPGFHHDVCSAIHPLAIASPFFRQLSLEEHGLEWIHPPLPLAHPFDDGSAATLKRSVDDTAAGLGDDARAYHDLMRPLLNSFDTLLPSLLAPLRLPRHPLPMARFARHGLQPARTLAHRLFETHSARALFAGLAAHSILPLERRPSAAFGLLLGMLGHSVGWPLPRGGSQRIADALVAILELLRVEIVTATRVDSLAALPSAGAVLLDLTPRQIVQIATDSLPGKLLRKLAGYRYGPGVCKLDLALDGPIPWTHDACARAGTVHVGGSLEEIAHAESEVWRGSLPERPFVLLTQSSLFDPTRAPARKHTAWAYCHVPHASDVDASERIEQQIERFAPGFRDRILARSVRTTSDLERDNRNLVGGDINGGVQDLRQLFTRPARAFDPYYLGPIHRSRVGNLFICSSSTPPGGGVHGMNGYHAAHSALRHLG
jgi:phytoene dehydrogenase-like protein